MIHEARKQDETISEWIDHFKCHIELYSSVLIVSVPAQCINFTSHSYLMKSVNRP